MAARVCAGLDPHAGELLRVQLLSLPLSLSLSLSLGPTRTVSHVESFGWLTTSGGAQTCSEGWRWEEATRSCTQIKCLTGYSW
jgi:hypothetical protein